MWNTIEKKVTASVEKKKKIFDQYLTKNTPEIILEK